MAYQYSLFWTQINSLFFQMVSIEQGDMPLMSVGSGKASDHFEWACLFREIMYLMSFILQKSLIIINFTGHCSVIE